jgi:hypothetical protein
MEDNHITDSLQALHASTRSLYELNMLLNAELKALRAFCVALAQNLPEGRQETQATFAMLCAIFRPDEEREPAAVERFDTITQLLSAALLAPPGSLPPSSLASPPGP